MDTFSLMKSLVAVKSVYPEEQEIAIFIEQELKRIGCKVVLVDCGNGRNSLVATTGKADKYLGFYGHIDTVPPAADYSRDPYKVITEEDKAFGLGVCDMKGGVACIINTIKKAKDLGIPLKAVFGVDEENISVGAYQLVDSGYMNDVDFLVVAESGQVQDYAQKYSLGYGRKGRVVIEGIVKGKKAHAAEAYKGTNAIVKAAEIIDILNNFKFPNHPNLGRSSIVIQRICAEADSFSVPDTCEVVFSLLSSPGILSSQVIQEIEEISRKRKIEATFRMQSRQTPYCEAYEIDRANKFLGRLEKEIFLPDEVTPVYNSSVADECIFANRLGIPVLTLGPIGGGDHTAGEWVSIPSLTRTFETFEKIVQIYAESK